MTDDPFHLQRFINAQDPVFDRVCTELRNGRKTSHWMWFIFPQIRGLGHSPIAVNFAISSLAEASAYLAHPILGRRLKLCTGLVNRLEGRSITEIFGYPDDLKFHSSMTLFSRAEPADPLFAEVLQKYFAGQPDSLTLARL